MTSSNGRRSRTPRRPPSRYRALFVAFSVAWACQDSAVSDDDSAASGAGGSETEGGVGSADAGVAEVGGAAGGGAPTPGGHAGAGGTNDVAGGAGLDGAGAGGGSSGTGGAGGDGAEPLHSAGAGGVLESPAARPPLDVSGAELVPGPPPDPRSPKLVPPIIELLAEATVTNGGSTVLGVRTASVLDPPRFVVWLADAEGHFVVQATKTAEAGLYELSFDVARYVRAPNLTVRIAPMDARGNIGAYQHVEYTLVHVGRGDVLITLSIDQEADLDLSVIEPSGFELSYQIPVSPTGGRLDLDSNAACEWDEADAGSSGMGNEERVSWPRNFAPTGRYEVYVKNYDDCGAAPVTFTVTVVNGSSEGSYTGRFPVESIGESSLVATFEHR